MPSIEVQSGDRNILEEKRCTDSPKLIKQIEENQPAKMPCSPYDKFNTTVPGSLPPETCDSLPLKRNGIVHNLTSMPAKPDVGPEMAEEPPPERGEAACEIPQQAKDAQNDKDMGTDGVSATVSKSTRPKPRSFSLLEMKYSKDKTGKGRGHLVRQRSVRNSFEKETHKLSHAASAPAAISDAMEPPMEDEVFGEDKDETSNLKQVGRDDTSSKSPTDVDCSEKTARDETEQESQEDQDQDEKDGGMKILKDGKHQTANGEMKRLPSSGKRPAEENQSDEGADKENPRNGKNEEEKAVLLEDIVKDDDEESTQEKPKTKEDSEDVAALTQDLQTSLKLEDDGSKEEQEDRPKMEEVQVSSLADDLEKGLSLEEKSITKPLKIKTELENTVTSTEQGTTRLRAKGVHRDLEGMVRRPEVILNTNNAFTQQVPLLPGQPSSQPPTWQMGAQPQGQTLPSLSVFLKPQRPTSQPAQSVVCPPGQGNQPRMYMGPPGTHQVLKIGSVTTQSMQKQYAQQQYAQQQYVQQQYAQQNLMQSYGQPNRGGAAFQSQQPMNIPVTCSTGTPSEVEWPPTPESDVDDILDLIQSEEESVRSPVENEEPMIDLVGVPSPQSPWNGSHVASVSSVSPVPSPYAGSQQSSPYPQVPDINGPWSPESNVPSPGDPRSPDSPMFIKPAGGMSAGTVTISPVSPHSPLKRRRNESSTDSEDAQEKIRDIKDFLVSGQDASPIHSPYRGYLANSPQRQQYSPALTPSYPTAVTPQVPAQSFPARISDPCFRIDTPQPSPQPCRYRQQETPPEGELDAYRKYLAAWSVEELLAPDDDKDTVLHVAICQMKVALSLAIIERIYVCKQKQSLNVQNKLQQTPLYLSVISNLPFLTQILINYGADLFIGNKHGNTPLHAAARSGNAEAIQAICKGMLYCGYTEESARRLFDTRNFEGKTPLMLAVESHCNQDADGNLTDCRETVRMLLTSFASSLRQDSNSGKTALHYAVELRKVDLICLLLEHCDDAGQLVNSQMYDGNTALHLIVGRALPEEQILHIVYLLMNRGANVGLENAAREKPLDLVHREHLEIKRRLHGQGNQRR